MAASRRLSLKIDQEAGAAYLRFSDEQVARSVEFDEVIVVDLDQHDVVVGVEILDLTYSVPLDELVDRFHVRTEALAILMQALRSSTPSHHVGPATEPVLTGTLTATTATVSTATHSA